MASSELINLAALIDDARCFELIRHHRWPEGIRCPSCTSATVVRNGRDDTQYERRRYLCKSCETRFDDLSGTILAGHHQPLRVWVLCLYFMGLNLANLQIAKELGLNASDVQVMTSQLREGLTARAPQPELSGAIEADEVYVVAGHKGHPDAVQKKPKRSSQKAQRRTRSRHA
jgi:transposase-like protein